jgi:hypothetical protein
MSVESAFSLPGVINSPSLLVDIKDFERGSPEEACDEVSGQVVPDSLYESFASPLSVIAVTLKDLHFRGRLAEDVHVFQLLTADAQLQLGVTHKAPPYLFYYFEYVSEILLR